MTTITLPRATVEQALEALENAEDQLAKPYSTDARKAITALRAALAQQAEPVDTDCHTQGICQRSGHGITQQAEPVEPVGQLAELQAMLRAEVDRLIAAGIQPQRKPLTDEEIDKIFKHLCDTVGASCKTMARAVERAHGIPKP